MLLVEEFLAFKHNELKTSSVQVESLYQIKESPTCWYSTKAVGSQLLNSGRRTALAIPEESGGDGI